MNDDPRMADIEAELDKLEAELDAEDAEMFGEPAPEPKPKEKEKFWTTEQMIADLGKVGIDVKKFNLPARSGTEDEAYEVLQKNGVTGESFKFPKPRPPQTDLQRLANALYGRK
jgi:hypothetical protein